MSYAPPTLRDLEAFWKKQGGVSAGIVGNAAHQKRASYHNGKDAITKYGRTAANDYSIRTKRDRAGLTNAASAIDLGRLDGSLANLYEFSTWFAHQCFNKAPGFRDVREVIYWSTARNRVVGWSALAPDKFINDYGDLSHKTHTHISYFRDSESRDKTAMFKRYPAFKPAPVPAPIPTPEDEVKLSQNLPGYTATIKKTANIRATPTLSGTIIRVVSTPENWVLVGAVKGDVDAGSDQWYVRWGATNWEYTAASNLIAPPLKPASTVELAAAKQAAADAQSREAAAKTALAACSTKVTKAQAALA